jgi:phospholipid-translocating P-type ATPase (flippase)
MLVSVFVFKLCLVFVCTFLGVAFDKGDSFQLIRDLYPGYSRSWLEYFAQYFILYSYMFPVSLTVTIEFIRLFHAVVIYNDPAIFDKEFGAAAARNSNVICQLGVVSHLLSDKTGTLTENLMQLRKFVTDGVTHTKGSRSQTPILLAMAICNTVVVLERDGEAEHHAESPDEAALVAFAARHGVELVFRNQLKMGVEIRGRRVEYDILATLPFDPERKRQSILLRPPGGPAILYCKGADSVIAQRSVDFNCGDCLAALASEGLRTLVFARREVPDDELNPWLERHRAAEAALNDRDRLVAESAAEIETRLSVLGVTGLEDRLQCEVPETIKWIRDAGIRVWVLTGDKLETAIAVGRMSGVIMEDSDLLKVVGGDSDTVGECFTSFANQNWTNPVLIVTGDALEHAMADHLTSFLNFADSCSAVILARTSPFEKAHVAEALRSANRYVMAVGDGANDVSMLQTAHVGVGIYGREGSHAALSADFALPRFRFLRRLLMVHGHWTFRRFGVVAVFMVYKNCVFIFVQFWFAIEALWSPTAYYNSFLMTCFNLLFTVWPPFIFGFWEQDLPQEVLLSNPYLYPPESDPMTLKRLALTLGMGVYQSMCAYYGMRLLMPRLGLSEVGTFSYMCAIYTVLLQILMMHHALNMWCFIFYIFQIVASILLIVLWMQLVDWDLWPVLAHGFVTPAVVLGWLTSMFMALGPGYMIGAMQRRFWPSEIDKFAEQVRRTGP